MTKMNLSPTASALEVPVLPDPSGSDVRSLGEVLALLEAAPCSVAELVALIPRLVCALGFDRALLSRVDRGAWTSESAYIVDDPEWAEQINLAGREQPQPLDPGLFETEVVRRREALVVTDVQGEHRVHRRIADASRSRSYVAAPIVSNGRVVGLLHADRYLQGRDPSEADKDLLVAFARAVPLALSRATMAERLRAVERSMANALVGLRSTTADLHDVQLDAAPAQFVGPPTATTPAPPPAEGLTDREKQVFELMAEGRTNAAIARELFIAESTVKRHVKHILRKLRARNRSEAIAQWFQTLNVSWREAP